MSPLYQRAGPRLCYRDERELEELELIGLLAQEGKTEGYKTGIANQVRLKAQLQGITAA